MEISFWHNTIVTHSNPTTDYKGPLLGTIQVRARTRRVIPIAVVNSKINEGYLPPIKTTEGVLIGEAAVINLNGICQVFVINTTDNDLKIDLPPQEIIPFEYYKFPGEDLNGDFVDEKDHVLEIVPGEPLTPTHQVQHKIHTLDDVPINTRPYRFSPSQRDEVERVIQKMKTEGAIQNFLIINPS